MNCSEETLEDFRAFADATGMSIAFQPADSQKPPTGVGCPNFCRLVGESLGDRAPCHAALLHGIHAAADSRKPQILRCFAHLHHIVVPVFSGATFAGSLLIGQVADRLHTSEEKRRVCESLRALGANGAQKACEQAYLKVPVRKQRHIEATVKLATLLAAGIVKTMTNGESQLGMQLYCVEQMRLFVAENFANECRLSDVSKRLGFCESYLSRAFHKHTGRSFTHYVTSHRIEHARNLLKLKQMRVLDIALASGFGSLSQFNRAFKQETGLPPSAWQARIS